MRKKPILALNYRLLNNGDSLDQLTNIVMKRIYTILLSAFIVCVSYEVKATSWTVSNNPAIIAQFYLGTNPLKAAVDSAEVGDTIYVHPSPNDYSSFHSNAPLAKKLVFFGGGWNRYGVDDHQTRIDYINMTSQASGCVFDGFFFLASTNDVSIVANDADDITIRNCRFDISDFSEEAISTSGACVNWSIINCIFTGDDDTEHGIVLGTDDFDFIIQNCIFRGAAIENASNTSIHVRNCAFLYLDSNTLVGLLNCSYTNVDNCIWANIPVNTCTSCVFNNNLSFGCGGTCSFLNSGSTGFNNLEGVDPTLVFTSWPGSSFSVTNDLRLIEGSPGIGAGNDGTDIGVFGGPFPFVWGTNYSGSPKTPQITELGLINPFIIENGSIQVTGKVVSGQ